ncbi:hypothetical protein C5E22_14375 [Pectobacterium parmentieri]|uniref:DUF1508 domain-containing protein n=1 Tax=Pectobacterium parmentieri TaxID=1905730 RepID=A0A8B3FBU8_PECPM|nr:hypothetical protein [Pectobacterium parmentieri]AOR59281.1 hypothetical protein A8F97_10205 [Pectobacterium parmentieri]AYH09706.1 hypothetical protein C5E24_08425 [Pectobacterium parmentieri]AYH19585.1 hypothetical protein C5E22_14375 [Pectobacterium parmentieri]AZS56087.1 hypothetical protein C5E18_08130 [Pectobacterium parmentieri]RKO75712.1 hypothetical protein C5E00_02390 [Pectobacterium parmentieri]
MCINIVISCKSRSEWNWRIVDKSGNTVVNSPRIFENRPLCIEDAERFLSLIDDAKFYDNAGVPIDQMHLSDSSRTQRGTLIKTHPAN